MACVLYFQTMTQRSGPLFPLSPRFYPPFRTVRRGCGPGFTIKVKNREKTKGQRKSSVLFEQLCEAGELQDRDGQPSWW